MRTALINDLIPVVQRAECTIHWIPQLIFIAFIRWMAPFTLWTTGAWLINSKVHEAELIWQFASNHAHDSNMYLSVFALYLLNSFSPFLFVFARRIQGVTVENRKFFSPHLTRLTYTYTFFRIWWNKCLLYSNHTETIVKYYVTNLNYHKTQQ